MGISNALLGKVALGTQIGGGLMGAVGAYGEAKSQKQLLRAQADMDRVNAQIAELGAQSALAQGQRDIANQTLQAGALKSRQRASLAANGVDLGEGNAAEIMASTDLMKSIDADTLRANSERTAWGYRTQSVNDMNSGALRDASAKTISPLLSAGTSLIGTAGDVAGSWYKLKNLGVF